MVSDVVQFLSAYEVWIYAVLGVIAIGAVTRLFRALNYWRGATFGIEKEIARRRFISSITTLIVIFVFAMSEFLFVSFSASSLPSIQTLATPTVNVLAVPTETLVPLNAANETVVLEATPTVSLESCIPGEVSWTFPEPGSELSGLVVLSGSANIPNFGFYKYEYAVPGSEIWTTIAGDREPKIENELGRWNTTQIIGGDYLLRLVVLDNENNEYGSCIVPVRILTP